MKKGQLIIKRSLYVILVFFSLSFSANAEAILEYAYKAEYGKAFSEISNLPKEDPSICVLKGVVLFSRFDDLGDTLDLDSALSILKKCQTNSFWEPLRRFEIGFINHKLGNNLKSFSDTKDAAKDLALRSDLDSKAFYAIYGYYIETLTDWIPFVRSKRDSYLADLKTGFEKSKMYAPIFGTSLIWILYKEKKYDQALNLTNAMLERYPEHPVILQMKADMLFKLGKVQETIAIYKQSEKLYAKRAPNSIRYWCAVTHLAAKTGDAFWKEKLQSAEYNAIKHRMPKIR